MAANTDAWKPDAPMLIDTNPMIALSSSSPDDMNIYHRHHRLSAGRRIGSQRGSEITRTVRWDRLNATYVHRPPHNDVSEPHARSAGTAVVFPLNFAGRRVAASTSRPKEATSRDWHRSLPVPCRFGSSD